jgi:RNA polymerase sigma-70 factor (ECF subfamily)
MSDSELIAMHRDGQTDAFAILFERYQGSIFNLVHRMVRGEDAYDLTQDIFLKALRALPTFRGDSKFSTWIFTIARHTCLNHLRHKGVLTEESLETRTEENESTAPVSRRPSVERSVELRELEEIVGAVLARMPADARLLLVLRDFEQLSYEEISQITELSIVNVKSRIHRARQLFKRLFTPWMDWLPEGTLP